MKKLLLILAIVLFIGCEPRVEGYIGGKPFFTKTYCDSTHLEYRYCLEYGYNALSGEWENRMVWKWEPVCVRLKTDTIFMPQKKAK